MSGQKLYLLVGYPGAGKTTIAQLIATRSGAVHIWTDHERQRMFGSSRYTPAENARLYEYLNAETDRLLDAGKSVVFDTNFNFRHDRQRLRDIASKHDAETVVLWINTPKEIARARAVEQSHGQATRLYGNMSAEDFERIASHLEPPAEDENILKIDGTKLDEQRLVRILQL